MLVARLTILTLTTATVILTELALLVPPMHSVMLTMVVLFPTNLDVITSQELVVLANLILIAPLLLPTAELMASVMIAVPLPKVQPALPVEQVLMVLRPPLPPIKTVILKLVSVLTSVLRILIVPTLATPTVNLIVDVAWNV
jgi:hypothetical protein